VVSRLPRAGLLIRKGTAGAASSELRLDSSVKSPSRRQAVLGQRSQRRETAAASSSLQPLARWSVEAARRALDANPSHPVRHRDEWRYLFLIWKSCRLARPNSSAGSFTEQAGKLSGDRQAIAWATGIAGELIVLASQAGRSTPHGRAGVPAGCETIRRRSIGPIHRGAARHGQRRR